jgi:putative heme-binding domain-containing protein
MEALAQSQPADFISLLEQREQRLTLREKQAALRLAARAGPDGERFINGKMESLLGGKLAPDLVLDTLEASRASRSSSILARRGEYEKALDPRDPLAKYRPALAGGDPEAGLEVFKNNVAGQCVRCHESGGLGHQVGPILAGIGSRVTAEYLLESLVAPSARIADGFQVTRLVAKDGDVIDGIKLSENDREISLRLASGDIRTVPVATVESQSASSVSVMPPMGEILTMFQLRDLTAYLASLK